MPRNIISGDPGSTWSNDGEKTQFQLIVHWGFSCGLCVQFDHQIGPYWPIPFHRRCVCTQSPVLPGQESRPFVDYRAKILTVSPSQQAAIMGRANLTLVEQGIVKWDDVVTAGRIRSLREVVSRNKLTVAQMVASGVASGSANEAFNAVNTGVHTAKEVTRKAQIATLMAAGYTKDQIKNAASIALANRVKLTGVVTFPPIRPVPPPIPIPVPVAAPLYTLEAPIDLSLFDNGTPDHVEPAKPEVPKVDIFREPNQSLTVEQNAAKFPGLTIRPDQVADYTANSATPYVMTHRTSVDGYNSLMKDGIDLDKTSGIIGQGLYVSSHDETYYGKKFVKVAIDARNPLIGTPDELYETFQKWAKTDRTPSAEEIRRLTIENGYDLIVWKWDDNHNTRDANGVLKYWQVIIHPEQCRFVVED